MSRRMLTRDGFKDRITLQTTAEESGGRLLRYEYMAHEVTPMPAEHAHADLDERVEVLSGRLHYTLQGKVHVLEAGETVDIPRGVAHTLWNEWPAGTRSIGEFRPAGNMEKVFALAFPIAQE